MVRRDQYLSIETKTKFIKTLVVKIQGVVATTPHPPLVRRVTKNTLVRRELRRNAWGANSPRSPLHYYYVGTEELPHILSGWILTNLNVNANKLTSYSLIMNHLLMIVNHTIQHQQHCRATLGCDHIEVYGIRYSLCAIRFALRHRRHSSDVAWKERNLVCGGDRIVQRIPNTIYRKLLCDRSRPKISLAAARPIRF